MVCAWCETFTNVRMYLSPTYIMCGLFVFLLGHRRLEIDFGIGQAGLVASSRGLRPLPHYAVVCLSRLYLQWWISNGDRSNSIRYGQTKTFLQMVDTISIFVPRIYTQQYLVCHNASFGISVTYTGMPRGGRQMFCLSYGALSSREGAIVFQRSIFDFSGNGKVSSEYRTPMEVFSDSSV